MLNLSKILAAMILFMAIQIPSALAREWDVLMDKSLGADALKFDTQGLFATTTDTILADGSISNKSTDSVTYDRYLLNFTDIQGVIPFPGRGGLRLNLFAQYTMRSMQDDQANGIISRHTYFELYPRIDGIFFAKNNMEIFAGVTIAYIPQSKMTTESPVVKTLTTFGEATTKIPHIGVVKRSGFVDGGFYFKQRAEKSRSIKKYTSQDNSELVFSDLYYDPAQIGIFAQTTNSPIRFFGEFTAIQGSDGGNKTDTGDSVMEDYARFRFATSIPISGSATTVRVALNHKTLSYADNRNVSIPSVPMTSLFVHLLQGTDAQYTYLGFMYGLGKDVQSIPEFNATYKLQAYGLSAGVKLAF